MDEPPLPPLLGLLGTIVCALLGAVTAAIEVLLVPVYIGRFIFPISVALALVVNVALPRFGRAMVGSAAAIALPIVAWVVAVLVLVFGNSSGGSVLIPGAGNDEYVGVSLLFGGALAGTISVIRETNRRQTGR